MPIDSTHIAVVALLIIGAVPLLIYGIRFYQTPTPADITGDWRTGLVFRHTEMEEHLRTLPPIPEHGEDPATPEERKNIKDLVAGVSAKARAYNQVYDFLDDLESARESFGVALIGISLALLVATGSTLGAIQFERLDAILWIWFAALFIIASLGSTLRDGLKMRKIQSSIRTEATKSMGLERVEI